jgi:hypothetical protein
MNTIDVADLPKGIYMIKVNAGEKVITKKVIK